jgi:hypothetical protein
MRRKQAGTPVWGSLQIIRDIREIRGLIFLSNEA